MTYEDGIGDLVTDLVGVTLTDGLGGEEEVTLGKDSNVGGRHFVYV